MLYVIYSKESEKFGEVLSVITNVREEQKEQGGIEIDDVLKSPENIYGMVPVLKIDLDNKSLYYNYTSVETTETKVQKIIDNTLPSMQDRQSAEDLAIMTLMDAIMMG